VKALRALSCIASPVQKVRLIGGGGHGGRERSLGPPFQGPWEQRQEWSSQAAPVGLPGAAVSGALICSWLRRGAPPPTLIKDPPDAAESSSIP